jgi:NAD(P)-dependent dehydrogenase (short-subunit alcohol dehydrogenase family)
MRVERASALVTGANRGLGRALCRALVDRGAAKVYAGARDPDRVGDDGVVPVRLDIRDSTSVAAAAEMCRDVTLLVNNAGIATLTPILGPDLIANTKDMIDTNVFGTLDMCRAFAPILARNGGGALVNILSIASFVAVPGLSGLCMSKSALWSLTNCMRMELRDQHTLVVAIHASFIDTDMSAGLDVPKLSAADVATAILDGVDAGKEELLLGDRTVEAKTALSRDLELIYPAIEAQWRAGRQAAGSGGISIV